MDDLADLSPAELETLVDWEGHFRGKYLHVGKLVEPERVEDVRAAMRKAQ